MILDIIRDLAIIFLALESIVVLVLLSILIWQIWRLMVMLQTEIKPLILDAQDTVSTVRGTTTFMSENVVTPVMQANSKVAGYRRTVQVLIDGLRGSKPQAARMPGTTNASAASAIPPAPTIAPPMSN